jgi:hypothetical protein
MDLWNITDLQLVGGAITTLKNMKVNGKDYPIYYGKIKMSQTTNQCKINMEYHGFTMMDVNYV